MGKLSSEKNEAENFIFDRVKKYDITLKISAQSDQRCPSSKHLKLYAFKEGTVMNIKYDSLRQHFTDLCIVK